MSDHSYHSSTVHGSTRDPREEINLRDEVRRHRENVKKRR